MAAFMGPFSYALSDMDAHPDSAYRCDNCGRRSCACEPEPTDNDDPAGPYVVTLADRAGPYDAATFATFDEALVYAADARRIWAGKVVRIVNADRGEDGGDGLTEEQRERIGEVARG